MSIQGLPTLSERFRELRAALVGPLSDGSWDCIKEVHTELGVPWREDLKPGWGKPKYTSAVLRDLTDEDVVGIGRRVVLQMHPVPIHVQDALMWIDAGGMSYVSVVTRQALARYWDGNRIHPDKGPTEALSGFSQCPYGPIYTYDNAGKLIRQEASLGSLLFNDTNGGTWSRASHLQLMEEYGLLGWPDARLFQFLEYLVHPTVRTGKEQEKCVTHLNGLLAADQIELYPSDQISGHPVFSVRSVSRGVKGRPKNLIFASIGPKPELAFADAINNDIVILKHGEKCLVYGDPIGADGLPWRKLVEWWSKREGLDLAKTDTRISLGKRLRESLASPPEHHFFDGYFWTMAEKFASALPALIPQVYLHYDPRTLRELRDRGDAARFNVQRMDFLLLLPHGARVVIEIDGIQHYSGGPPESRVADPSVYAKTVRGDRNLRLMGYEVYRFGGHELYKMQDAKEVVREFFGRLFRRHKVEPCV